MFMLAFGTVLSFLALILWLTASIVSFLAAGLPISGSLLLLVPKPVVWLVTGLPILLILEGGLFLYFSRRRWRNTPHTVRWEIIPNHNVVVAMTAYNDEASIGEAVKEFRSQKDVKEVIVVDNNSKDRTSVIATEAGARVVHEPMQGYGYACIRGLKEALDFPKVNVVVLVEGDMTFDGRD